MKEQKQSFVNLYHYTTFENGCKILDSKHLWLFKSTALSDPLEVRFGMSCLVEALLNIADEPAFTWKKELRLLIALTCTLFKFSPIHEVPSKQLKRYKLSLREDGTLTFNGRITKAYTQSIYLASFAAKRDDILQWRLYSANGTGVSLQLSVPVGKTKITLSQNEKKLIHILNVRYTTIEKAVRHLERQLIRMLKNNAQLPDVAKHCWNEAVSMKQEDYRHEDEVRVVVYGRDGVVRQSYLKTPERLRPFIALPLNSGQESGGLALKEIMTGPRSSFDGAKDEDWKQYVESSMSGVVTAHSSKHMR